MLSCVLAHKYEQHLNKALKPLVDIDFKGQGNYLKYLCKTEEEPVFFYVMMVNVAPVEMSYIYENLTSDFLYRNLK